MGRFKGRSRRRRSDQQILSAVHWAARVGLCCRASRRHGAWHSRWSAREPALPLRSPPQLQKYRCQALTAQPCRKSQRPWSGLTAWTSNHLHGIIATATIEHRFVHFSYCDLTRRVFCIQLLLDSGFSTIAPSDRCLSKAPVALVSYKLLRRPK